MINCREMPVKCYSHTRLQVMEDSIRELPIYIDVDTKLMFTYEHIPVCRVLDVFIPNLVLFNVELVVRQYV